MSTILQIIRMTSLRSRIRMSPPCLSRQRRPSGVSRTRNQSCSHFRSADSAHRLLAVPDGYPDITTSPMLKAVELGRPAQMQCEATGTPKPEINWLKDYIPVELTDPRLSLLDSGKILPSPLPLLV